MVNLLALSPMLALILGAVAMQFAPRIPRARLFISIVSILLALLLLFLNAWQSNGAILLFPVASSVPDLDLSFSFNAGALFFAGIALIAVFACVLVENVRFDARVGSCALLTLAGVVAFFCADNWTTLAAAWLSADIGLLLWQSHVGEKSVRVIGWRVFASSQVGAFLFLVAGALLLSDGSSLRWPDVQLGGWPATLVLLAAWIRSGIYPFHRVRPVEMDAGLGYSLREFALPMWLGAYLLVRAVLRLQVEPAYPEVLQFLALLSLGATTLLSLSETEPEKSLWWGAQAMATLIFLSLMVTVLVRAAFTIWLVLGLFNFAMLGWGASLLRAQPRRQPWLQVLWGVAALCAVGFPLTPTFWGRVGYYAAMIQSGDGWMFALLFVATTLALVSVWRVFRAARTSEERHLTRVEYAGIVLLILPLLIEGMFAFKVAGFFWREVEDASIFVYDALAHAPSAWIPIVVLMAVILPLPLAFFLLRAADAWRARFDRVARLMIFVLDLSALKNAIARGVNLFGALLHNFSASLEAYPVGWVLFAAIWIAVWLLNTR